MPSSRKTVPQRPLCARRTVNGGLAGLVATASLLVGTPAQAAPPTPPDASTTRAYLDELTVRPEGSSDGYSRSKFPHWINQSGACNTRETVLQRDGEDVQQDSRCAAVSGTWHSPYDGATWHSADDVDIDHVVPLAEAWRSGASDWTTEQRKGFANDLTHAQLIAVTDDVNQAKGDQDPAEWLPSLTDYRCSYARMWVWVKHHYDLAVDSAEKDALSAILGGC